MGRVWHESFSPAPSHMNEAAAAAAPWVERLARVGYVSKGLVYTIIGSLTAAAALGHGRSRGDSSAAFRFILEQPFGRVLIGVVALGLFGYAAWRIINAITDPERRGSDAKGLAIRAGGFARGALYGSIAFEALRLALGRSGGGGNDDEAQHWTARILDAPFGQWIVVAAGAGIAGYGVYQLYRAWQSKLGKELRLHWVTDRFTRRLVAISRFGIAARAVVFLFAGLSVARAAWQRDPGEVQGMGGALRDVGAFSQWLLIIVAIGLVAYGVYQFVNARYRRIST